MAEATVVEDTKVDAIGERFERISWKIQKLRKCSDDKERVTELTKESE